MVLCELIEPYIDDYGQRIIRIPNKVFDILKIEDEYVVEVIANKKRLGVIAKLDVYSIFDDYYG
jgi:hypothetical protein